MSERRREGNHLPQSGGRLNAQAPAFIPNSTHSSGYHSHQGHGAQRDNQGLDPPPGFTGQQEFQEPWSPGPPGFGGPSDSHGNLRRRGRGRSAYGGGHGGPFPPGFEGASDSYGRAQERGGRSGFGQGVGNRPLAADHRNSHRINSRGHGRSSAQSSRPQATNAHSQEPAQQSHAETGGSAGEGPSTEAKDLDDEDRPTCVVCYEDLELSSIGSCNHNEVCGMCSLRMRKSFNNLKCPLCKAHLHQVVITPWREGLPRWDALEPQLQSLWWDRTWLSGVFIDNAQHAGVAPRKRKVSAELMAKTGRICGVCDKEGNRPFSTLRRLFEHQRTAHDKAMCPICLQGLGHFPGEMPLYDVAELKDHLSTHPSCQFCKENFMDTAALMTHVQEMHYSCFICSYHGRELFFGSSEDFWRHLNREHHACTFPDCRQGFIAFASALELREHHSLNHPPGQTPPSNVTSWQDASRLASVEMAMSDIYDAQMPMTEVLRNVRAFEEARFAALQADEPVPETPEELRVWMEQQAPRALGHRRGRRRGRGRGNLAAQFERQAAVETRRDPQSAPPRAEPARQEGLRMFDDDFGLTGEAFPDQGLPNSSDPAAGTVVERDREELGNIITTDLAEELAQGANLSQQELARGVELSQLQNLVLDPFPALPGSAPVSALASQGPSLDAAQPSPSATQTSYRYPRLTSTTRRCPCGRRSVQRVGPEGAEVAPLECDDTCARLARRAQLADAFGVADPDNHVAAIDRNRTVTYTPDLLAYAHEHNAWIKDVESLLAMFVRSNQPRVDWPSMPRTQRKIAHELAAAYGVTTQSYGQEPTRHLRLFRGSNTGIPSNKLSVEAARMSLEQVRAAVAAQQTFSLRLTDVESSADLPRMFARWRGECTIEGPGSDRVAVITFANQAGLQDAASAFGGGIRGKFRVDRSSIQNVRSD